MTLYYEFIYGIFAFEFKVPYTQKTNTSDIDG
jgi:hypothetical protein